MSAWSELAVVLSDDEGATLRVTFDADMVEPAEQVDVTGNGNRLFSCSLDEIEEFAKLLGEFVERHRAAGSGDR